MEISNFVHAMIQSRPKMEGHIEVEAKLGLLKHRGGEDRVMFPVRSETSEHCGLPSCYELYSNVLTVLASDDHRFESNMTAVRNLCLHGI